MNRKVESEQPNDRNTRRRVIRPRFGDNSGRPLHILAVLSDAIDARQVVSPIAEYMYVVLHVQRRRK